ncbi:MAG: hypothetical protein HY300_07385, partial [Verrucomicrobia bacterium]|nr:hypothetical protein [Verrucomicrobiota bacterium]
LAKLVADLATIKTRAQVSAELKQQLQRDLTACARGAARPAAESLTKLADDISAGFAGKKVSPQEQNQLAKDIVAALNPGDAQAAISEAKDLLIGVGLAEAEAGAIAADLRGIAGELAKTSAKQTSK